MIVIIEDDPETLEEKKRKRAKKWQDKRKYESDLYR